MIQLDQQHEKQSKNSYSQNAEGHYFNLEKEQSQIGKENRQRKREKFSPGEHTDYNPEDYNTD